MAGVTTADLKPLEEPKLWTPGDWNAFFGFGTNILVNLLVLTGLLRFVIKMPDSLVFGRILPATGFALAAAALTFFGFMHGESIGIGESPTVAIAYLGVSGILLGCYKFAHVAAPVPATESHEEEMAGAIA